MLTLLRVAQNPRLFTRTVLAASDAPLVIRPLMTDDADSLAMFLQGLSPETRRFSIFSSYDRAMALELCDAISRYDKLRFIIEPPSGQIAGMLEFSFAITENDRVRYAGYSFSLDPETDCRFGPTLADEYQNRGIGTLVLPFMKDLAREFGRKRIVLWGGVLADNGRAIRYYQKNGFQRVGTFQNSDGFEAVDMILAL